MRRSPRASRRPSTSALALAALGVAVLLAASCGSGAATPAGPSATGSSLPADDSGPWTAEASVAWPSATTTEVQPSPPGTPPTTPAATATAAATSRAGTPKPPITPAPAPATPRPTPLPAATPTPAPAAGPCYVFPSSNVWNRDISGLPVAANSAVMVDAIGRNAYLRPDYDAIGDGIPYNVVTSATPVYSPAFDYADESDPGPYPIPSSPRIEAGSDRHLLAIDLQQCRLWELFDARPSGGGWAAGSGAVFDLRSNALRPAGWTSADAAGLPIFPGLVRYEEVVTGAMRHAIRFTAPATCGYIYPARHLTAAACSNLPPMGLRVRLKASVDISGFGANAQVVLTALKHYGMILADNGSPWYISGSPDSRWNDDEMHRLQTLTGSDFEVVDTSSLRNG